MKRTAYLGCLLFFLALAPTLAVAQAIDDRYTEYYPEQEPAKKAQLGEKFLADFKEAAYHDAVYKGVLELYVKLGNMPKVLDWATKLDQLIAKAEPQTKGLAYVRGLAAAQQTNNNPQTIVFAEKVLTIAPDDPNTLLTLAGAVSRSAPADAAGKKAALDKALQHANKGIAALAKTDAKTAGFSDADWKLLQGSLHGTAGEILFNQGDYEKAAEQLVSATKAVPAEGVNWYLLGLTYEQQLNGTNRKYQAAHNERNLAIKNKADRATIDDLSATVDAFQEVMRSKIDEVIATLATAVANGTQAARARLEAHYKQKNNDSLQGLDQLIASKKK